MRKLRLREVKEFVYDAPIENQWMELGQEFDLFAPPGSNLNVFAVFSLQWGLCELLLSLQHEEGRLISQIIKMTKRQIRQEDSTDPKWSSHKK